MRLFKKQKFSNRIYMSLLSNRAHNGVLFVSLYGMMFMGNIKINYHKQYSSLQLRDNN